MRDDRFVVLTLALVTVASGWGRRGTSTIASIPALLTVRSPALAPVKAVDMADNSTDLWEDREIDCAKPKGRIHIICLCGSATFGVQPVLCRRTREI